MFSGSIILLKEISAGISTIHFVIAYAPTLRTPGWFIFLSHLFNPIKVEMYLVISNSEVLFSFRAWVGMLDP